MGQPNHDGPASQEDEKPERLKMRIAVLGSRGYPSTYGGYETFVRHFVPRALEDGHDVLVYCRWRRDRQWVWDVGGAECRATPGLDTKSLSTLSFGLTSAIDVTRRSVDVALVMNCANGFWLPLLNAGRLPVAVNVDGVEWERRKWSRTGRMVFRLGAGMVARQANAVIADSKAIADIWRRDFGVNPFFIPYGAPIVEDDSSDQLDVLGIPEGRFVLTVARLVPENNVELLLDSWESLTPRPPLVVVGSANYRSDLEARLRHLSRDRDVWWLGHVANQRLLTQLWRHCAVYVHGHSVGGTNPALLQALGAGAPTLAFDSVFNREVIGMVDAFFDESSGSLSRQLERVLGSPSLRRELATRGRERIRETYLWHDVCDDYLELLGNLVRASANGGS
jgi:glycosyltransferase involved in cell wall biosynthesis